MIYSIYKKYFAKDKPFRHVTQHLAVALTASLFATFLLKIPPSPGFILLFCLFTYIPDTDGLPFFLIHRNKNHLVARMLKSLKNGKFMDAATTAVTNHKRFDQLLFHNIFFLPFPILLFAFFAIKRNAIGIACFGAISTHLLFDIADDLYQLGHLNNWLWIIKKP